MRKTVKLTLKEWEEENGPANNLTKELYAHFESFGGKCPCGSKDVNGLLINVLGLPNCYTCPKCSVDFKGSDNGEPGITLDEAFEKYGDEQLMRRKSWPKIRPNCDIGWLKNEKIFSSEEASKMGFAVFPKAIEDVNANDWETVSKDKTEES